MSTSEIIQERVHRLPPAAQQEVLEAVERIEQRYKQAKAATGQNDETVYPLTLIANMAVDVGVTDLAERHDSYAHGKLEG